MAFFKKCFALFSFIILASSCGHDIHPTPHSQTGSFPIPKSPRLFVSPFNPQHGLGLLWKELSNGKTTLPASGASEAIQMFVSHVTCPRVKACVEESNPFDEKILAEYLKDVEHTVMGDCDSVSNRCRFPQLQLVQEGKQKTAFGHFHKEPVEPSGVATTTGRVGSLSLSPGTTVAAFATHYLDAWSPKAPEERAHSFALLNGVFSKCLARIAANEELTNTF